MFGPIIQTENYGFKTYDKERLENMINKYDKDMLITIANLYKSMTGENLDLENIVKAVDALVKYNTKSEYNYLNNLLYPERCRNVRIPSPIPVPSCSFQLHNCITLKTNPSGNLAFMFNPFFLGNQNDLQSYVSGENTYTTNWLTSLWVNSDADLTGNQPNDHFMPVNIGQMIPNVYDQYRLVSASLVVKYIGRLDIVSGVIGGAIIYEDNPTIGANFSNEVRNFSSANPSLAKYGNFDLAMDSFYHQEYMVLDGLRQLYFPIDNSYEEYTKLGGTSQITYARVSDSDDRIVGQITDNDFYKSGFNQFVYVLGAPPSSACFKIDIYCNFECLPNAAFLNYMPTSTCLYSISNQEKKEIIDTIQKTPIMKSNEFIDYKIPSNLGWKGYMYDMAKRLNAMPGVPKLISMGLEYFVPKLKPTLAVLGTMISNTAQQQQQPPQQQQPQQQESQQQMNTE